MTLRLSIENMDRLPDGGPMRLEVKGRGLDVGRDAYLDWTLPDPTRHISGKHCEIRFREGGYWLHDVSTNGTFVNGAPFRLDGPYLLRDGDRLSIGSYIVRVEIPDQGPSTPSMEPAASVGEDLWGAVGVSPAPDDRREYRPQKLQAKPVEFFDFAAPINSPGPIPDAFAPPPRPSDDEWLSAIPAARRVAAAPVAAPTPRRQTTPQAAAPLLDAAAPGPTPSLTPPQEPKTSAPESAAIPTAAQLISRIAAAAGIDDRAIAGRDPLVLADEIGAALAITARNLAQLLRSRAETKSLMRSSSQTMIRATENNPFKFTSEPEEALAIIFGPRTRGYLDGPSSFERSFADVKAHQLLTFGAIQGALEALFEDLAPEKIDRSAPPERGLGALVASRKAKLWDIYLERWRAKTKRADGRLNEAFMTLLADAYDKLQKKSG